MTVETDIIALKARTAELEDRVKFLYKFLRIEFAFDPSAANARIMDAIRTGNKVEAIKTYREVFDVGLAEAKLAIDALESALKK